MISTESKHQRLVPYKKRQRHTSWRSFASRCITTKSWWRSKTKTSESNRSYSRANKKKIIKKGHIMCWISCYWISWLLSPAWYTGSLTVPPFTSGLPQHVVPLNQSRMLLHGLRLQTRQPEDAAKICMYPSIRLESYENFSNFFRSAQKKSSSEI